VEPGNGRDRHAGPSGLLDQPDLPLGTAAPPALVAGDEFNALHELGHQRVPALEPRSSGYATCPVETGCAPCPDLVGCSPVADR
jgi:hypothetical protein